MPENPSLGRRCCGTSWWFSIEIEGFSNWSRRIISISRIKIANASSKLNRWKITLTNEKEMKWKFSFIVSSYGNVAKSTWIFAPLIMPNWKQNEFDVETNFVFYKRNRLPNRKDEIAVALNTEYTVFSIQLRILIEINEELLKHFDSFRYLLLENQSQTWWWNEKKIKLT